MNMMRTNLVLAVVAAGLAVPTWLTIQADRTEFTSFEDIPKLFAGFTPENVKAVVVSTVKLDDAGEPAKDQSGNVLRDSVQLAAKDDGWVLANTDIAGVRVRPGIVRERVFDHLDRIRIDQKAVVREAASPDELREFGLAEDQAVVVQCFDAASRPIAQLLIGDDAAGGKTGEDVVRGFYVRSSDSSDVVLYEQVYWIIDADRDQWVDRAPMRFEVDQAVRLELHNAKGDMVLVRDVDSPDWTLESGPAEVGAVRAAEVRAFVQTLSEVHVQRYVKRIPPAGPQRDAAVAEFGLATPKLRAMVGLADGTEFRLAVGSQVPGQNEYYMSASAVEFLMAVGDWISSPLERDPVGFFDPPAARVNEQPATDDPPEDAGERVKPIDPPKEDAVADPPKEDAPEEDGTVDAPPPETPVDEPSDDPAGTDPVTEPTGEPPVTEPTSEPPATEPPKAQEPPAGDPAPVPGTDDPVPAADEPGDR